MKFVSSTGCFLKYVELVNNWFFCAHFDIKGDDMCALLAYELSSFQWGEQEHKVLLYCQVGYLVSNVVKLVVIETVEMWFS